MKVYSIFLSLAGEINYYRQGTFCTFIRLSGCNFYANDPSGCNYCDTQYALNSDSGKEMTVDQIVYKVKELGVTNVLITGGEPMMQGKELYTLIKTLTQELNDCTISIETNGSYVCPPNWPVGAWIVDWKLPSSGQSKAMNIDYFLLLKENDWIKFVIQDRQDYDVAIKVMEELDGWECKANYAVSPILGKLDPATLINWLKEDECYGVTLNLQLHKIVSFDESK